jgi:hypothetical protein
LNIELWRESGGIRERIFGPSDISLDNMALYDIHLTPVTSGMFTFKLASNMIVDYSRVQVFEGDNIELYLNSEILWTGYVGEIQLEYKDRIVRCQPSRNTFNDVLRQGNTLALYGQVHNFDGAIPVRKIDISFLPYEQVTIQYESLQNWKLRKDDRVCGGG